MTASPCQRLVHKSVKLTNWLWRKQLDFIQAEADWASPRDSSETNACDVGQLRYALLQLVLQEKRPLYEVVVAEGLGDLLVLKSDWTCLHQSATRLAQVVVSKKKGQRWKCACTASSDMTAAD